MNEGKVLQAKLQRELGLISYGVPYYFVTAGATKKQQKMVDAVEKNWNELAQELSSIGGIQYKAEPANKAQSLQTKHQTLLGSISHGIPYYFVTAGTTEKQKKMLEAVKRKWGELAQELNSIREHQHSCPDGQIWCVQTACCCAPADCPDEWP